MAELTELRAVIEGQETLGLEGARALMRRILAGAVPEMQLAALLGAMGARGESPAEIAGFALGLREAATPLPLTESERDALVDTCGTGGDGSGTFNISTAAALVAAAAGARVAKHGNRAVTSRCGSADVLEALGIPISLAPGAAADALRRHRFCFLLAPAHHPGMAAVLPVRKALGVRTIFNVLGPLLNPAGARRQVMGVYNRRLVPVVAGAMTHLGVAHGYVVHGEGGLDEGGLDEFSLSGVSSAAAVTKTAGSGSSLRSFEVTPEEFGLKRAPLEALRGGNGPVENAAILTRVLGLAAAPPEVGPKRDVVLLNAAAVLVAAGVANDLRAGVALAAESIDTRAVAGLVARLRAG